MEEEKRRVGVIIGLRSVKGINSVKVVHISALLNYARKRMSFINGLNRGLTGTFLFSQPDRNERLVTMYRASTFLSSLPARQSERLAPESSCSERS